MRDPLGASLNVHVGHGDIDDSRWLVRSTLLLSLSDESIHETIKKFVNVPLGSSWLIGETSASDALRLKV